MSLQLLAYAFPLVDLYLARNSIDPTAYRELDEAPESQYSSRVKRCVGTILSAENQVNRHYYARVRELIQNFQHAETPRNINELFRDCLRVVDCACDVPFHTEGTDQSVPGMQGKYFIKVDPQLTQYGVEAIKWLSAREVCHILEDDAFVIKTVKAIVSLVATLFVTLVLDWKLIPCAVFILLSRKVTDVLMSCYAESRADAFATRHCSNEQKDRAIQYLQEVDESQSSFQVLFSRLFGTSTVERIETIRGSMPPDLRG